MKILLIYLNICLTLSEKLDWTYLPPAGSSLSGGSQGDINLPLELPNTKYFSEDEGLSKTPELVIGIDRVSPNQADDTFEDIITHKPKITGNVNPFASNKPNPGFVQSSLFPKEVSTTTLSTIPKLNYNPSQLLDDFDNLQKIHNIEKHPSNSILNEKNRVYLPSYKNIYNTDEAISITLPPPVISDIGISNGHKYMPETDTYKDTSSLSSDNQQLRDISSITPPNYFNNINKNMTTSKYYSTILQYSSTTPIIPSKGKPSLFHYVNNQRPERVQAQSDRQAVILNYDQSINPDGYTFSYDTSNGIHGDEEGSTINGVKAKGSYSYIGDDGNVYEIQYTADENGFVPKGTHLPTAPPIPDAILKVIEQATKDKEAGIYDDGSYNEEKYGYKNLEEKHRNTNNSTGGANFSPENIRNIVRGGLFDEHENSHNENGLQIPVGINHNDIDSLRNKSDYDNKNSQLRDIVTNKKEQDPLSNLDLDVSISYENDETRPQTSSSYEYFPPLSYDINKFKTFPPQFFENDQDLQTKTNKSNTEKVTAKPFLTPYVTRKDTDLEIKDYDDQLGNKQQDTDFDDQSLKDELEEYYEDDSNDFDENLNENKINFETGLENEPNDKLLSINEELDSREYISEDKPGLHLQYEDKIHNANDLVPSDKEGLFYQNANKPFTALNRGLPYATSTAATTKFPTGISVQDINHTVRPSSFQIPVTSQTSYAIRPGTVNSESTYTKPDMFGNTVSLTIPKTTQTARHGYTGFDMQYSLGTESPKYPHVYNEHADTKDIIGEDFTGPKQPQRFDPVTGYHY